jgi:hypothetical protein
MKASISFPELQDILLEKAQQNINFSHVDDKTIHVVYPIDLGIIKKDLAVDLIVEELRGSDLLVQISAGKGTEILLNTALSLLKNKIPEGLMEKQDNNYFLIHLGTIEQVKSVFDAITVNDFKVLADGLQVEGTLKS